MTQLGQSGFTTYLRAFEATAGLLIIAVVGAVLLARRERPADEELELGDLVEDDAAELDDEIANGIKQGNGGTGQRAVGQSEFCAHARGGAALQLE